MGLKITSNGRNISPSDIAKEIKGGMFRAVEDEIRKKVNGARCPVHKKGASNIRVQVDPKTGKGSVDATSCCDELEKEIAKRMQ